jgi:hypothetical protein
MHSRCFRSPLEPSGDKLAVTEVTLVTAVGEPRGELPQVAVSDRFAAKRTGRGGAQCSAIDQNEFHVPPPNVRQVQRPIDTGQPVSNDHLFDGVTISRSVRQLLDRVAPAGIFLLLSRGKDWTLVYAT